MSQGAAGGEGAPQVRPEGKERQRKRRRRRRRKESQTRLVRSNLLLLPEAEAEKPKRTSLASNRLKTTKYTALSFLPKNLFEQFHRLANVYFVFIALLNFAPAVNAFQPELALAPVLFILAVTAIKDLWEDYSRYLSDKEINHMECLVYSRSGWAPGMGSAVCGLLGAWDMGWGMCGHMAARTSAPEGFCGHAEREEALGCPWSWHLPSLSSELQVCLKPSAFG